MNVGKPQDRIAALQVLRALAALLVVFTHAVNGYDERTDLLQPWLANIGEINAFGAIGVDVFFVISGFIMAHAMMRRPDLTAREFVIMRFIRVVPPYWLATLAVLPFAWSWYHGLDPNRVFYGLFVFPVARADAFVLPILHPGWSLAFELAFYIVVAAAIALMRSPQARFAATFGLVCTLGTLGTVWQPQSGAAAVFLSAIWFEFALGLLIYAIWSQWRPSEAVAWAVLIAGLLVLAKHALIGPSIYDDPAAMFWPDPVSSPDARTGLIRAIGWGIPSALVVLGTLWVAATRLGERLSQSRPWRGLARLGDASYALYLVHPFITDSWRYWVPANAIPADLAILGLIAASAWLGLIAHRRVEKPLLHWMRKRIAAPGSGQGKLASA